MFVGPFGALLTSDVNIDEVRVCNVEPFLIARWQHYYDRFRRQFVALLWRRNVSSAGASLLSTALVALATLLGLRRVAHRSLSVGEFSLFMMGIAHVQNQCANLFGGILGIYENLLYMRNLFDFLDMPSRDLDAGEEWRWPIVRIEFEHVSFRYPFMDRLVLSDVSFHVSKGQALGIVGQNGAGKTTILKLLTRLFEPTGGRILLNGRDAARYSPRSVQREIAALFQRYGQYSLTVRKNIGLGCVEAMADDLGLASAAEHSGAAGFIAELDSQYDAVLGRILPGGRQLSGGQWQQLALARLFFRPGSVQVFDEPTASLDAAAEADVVRRLVSRGSDHITFVVSHRLATIRMSDHILVLDGGRVIEAGSHVELMSAHGRYATYFDIQASGYRTSAVDGCAHAQGEHHTRRDSCEHVRATV